MYLTIREILAVTSFSSREDRAERNRVLQGGAMIGGKGSHSPPHRPITPRPSCLSKPLDVDRPTDPKHVPQAQYWKVKQQLTAE